MRSKPPSCLLNLKPESDAMPTSIESCTRAEIRVCGAITLKRTGQSTGLNLLWALKDALSNQPWREVARDDRLRLLTELEARGVNL